MTRGTAENAWRDLLVEGKGCVSARGFWKHIPSSPRCKLCDAPFSGVGGALVRPLGFRQLPQNPRYCGRCFDELAKLEVGGIEIELTMLFADVRGSTGLAEGMSPTAFGALMSRFYKAGTDALVAHDAFVDKFVGDEVVALFLPAFAGPAHARRAIDAARDVLTVTGHMTDSPWLPLGVGVHTGIAFVGAIGVEGGVRDISALGDAVNATARLASLAQPSEILVSEATATAAGIGGERRRVELRGRDESLDVRVLHARAESQATERGADR